MKIFLDLYNIDVVGSKKGKVLKLWEKYLNYFINKILSLITIWLLSGIVVFILYLGYKFIKLLINI